MRCARCGRILLRAAATIPAVDTGPMPHPAGALGRTCAVKRLIEQQSLFVPVVRKTIAGDAR